MENVKITVAGDIITVKSSTAGAPPQTIKKLDADHYVSYNTGEVKEYKHTISREQNVNNVKRTIARLRDIINANATDRNRLRWVTLTYADNVTDPKRVMDDFESFNRRVRATWGTVEYIATIEPQERGAWHLHVIYIYPTKAPYMDNAVVRSMWRQGFVNIHSVRNVANLGAYLSLYLSNIPTTNDKSTKRAKKGARLYLYPTGIRIYRCSRGIKRPSYVKMSSDDYAKNKERYLKAFGKEVYKKNTDVKTPTGYVVHMTTSIYSRYNDYVSQIYDINDDCFWRGYEIVYKGRHLIRQYHVKDCIIDKQKYIYKLSNSEKLNILKKELLTNINIFDNINMPFEATQISLIN